MAEIPLEAFPDPCPEKISCVVAGVICQRCEKLAEHHDFIRPEQHYCSEHAELHLVWYLDDYAREDAGLPPMTTQQQGNEQELLASEAATRRELAQEEAALP
jgi:hypothetical protein